MKIFSMFVLLCLVRVYLSCRYAAFSFLNLTPYGNLIVLRAFIVIPLYAAHYCFAFVVMRQVIMKTSFLDVHAAING